MCASWKKTVGTKIQGGPGSVWFGYGSCTGRFERFRLSVPTVPLWKGFCACFSAVLTEGDGSNSGWVPEKRFRRFRFLFGLPEKKKVLTVPVSGSGSVPGPS